MKLATYASGIVGGVPREVWMALPIVIIIFFVWFKSRK